MVRGSETGLRRLTAPRRLLALAALAAVVGLVSGYVDVHDRADRALALRQGPPPAVAVQAFDARRDTGVAGEILVRGEVNMDAAVVLPGPDGSPAGRIWVAPLFPLGDLGAALATGNADSVGATVSAQVARRAPVGGEPAGPVGYVLWPLDAGTDTPEGPGALGSAFGPGSMGEVIALNGVAAPHTPDRARIADALRSRGIDLPPDPLAVSPYPGGRTVALTESTGGSLSGWAYRLAVLLAVLGMIGMLRRRLSSGRPARLPAVRESGAAAAPGHPSFAPLTSQADISRAAAEDEASAPEHAGTRVAAVLRLFRSPR